MKTEELAYKWGSIKKVLITEDEEGYDFDNEMVYFKNSTSTIIYMSTVVINTDIKHHDYVWHEELGASNTAYPIMPGEMLGPLYAGRLYFHTLAGNAYLTVITKEVR